MKPWIKTLTIVAILSGLVYSCTKHDDFWESIIPETKDQPTSSQIKGYVFRPAQAPASDANIQQLKVPPGFTVNKFADGLGKPRILAISSAGNVYASDREAGIVMMLKDTNANGIAWYSGR